jgi:predicted 2-oxoglutarate/Fe(II)-dependent dioxygenase YbiX
MNLEITTNNYIYLPNFIDSEIAKQLAVEFKQFTISNKSIGDGQAPNSSVEYNYIGFLELLCEKTPEVSKFLGEKVLPTYSYARVYKEGSDLKPHSDREACEISLTIHLDGDCDWPIYIKKPNGEEVSLNLKSGDAMMYLGCQAEHWREQFQGKEYVQVFLHYVKSRGENSFAYFDKVKEKPTTKTETNSNTKVITLDETKSIQKTSKNINDYIVEFENIIPDYLIDTIFREYEHAKEWAPSYIGEGVIDTSVRNVNTIQLSYPSETNTELRKAIDSELFSCAGEAIKKYNELFPHAKIVEDSGYELLRYNVGQFYIEHTDSFNARPRSVSCSFMLNDDYEGGEFAFFNRELKLKPKKGSVLMFPSNFMYPHEIMPVTQGVRYSIITWFI